MTIRGIGSSVLLLAVVAAGCGASQPATDEPSQTSSTATVAPESDAAEDASPATTEQVGTSAAAPAATSPVVAALTSGRGDDGSLEVGIWFTTDPFAFGDVRLLVGADSDDSFPGSGNPVTHLDGWVEIRADGLTLFDAGSVVASDDQGDLGEWLTWTGPGRSGFVYFFGNVPVRAGVIWVLLEVDGAIAPGGAAGAPFGTGCSFRAAGVDFNAVAGDVPDPGAPCRYPLG